MTLFTIISPLGLADLMIDLHQLVHIVVPFTCSLIELNAIVELYAEIICSLYVSLQNLIFSLYIQT